MPTKVLQAAFVSGEISPTLLGRVDIPEYANGAKRLRNVYVSSQGGVFRREGMAFIDRTESDNPCRLIEFVFSEATKYLLAFTDQRVDIYKNDAVVHSITTGVVTDITEARLRDFKVAQSGDYILIVHPDVEPIQLVNDGTDTGWTASRISFDYIPSFAYGAVTQTAKTSTLSFTKNSKSREYTVTSTASDFTAVSEPVGQNILFKSGILEIIERVADDEVIAIEITEPVDYSGTSDWILESGYEEVWSSTRGWPRSVIFYQNRLWFGGSKGLPNGIWASKIGDFFNFLPGESLDDDTLFGVISDEEVVVVNYMRPGRALEVYTNAGEFYLTGSGVDQAITPSSFRIVPSTRHGSKSDVRAVGVDGATLFVERNGAVVREFVYNEVEQNYNAKNISILSEHLIRTPIDVGVRKSSTRTPSDYVYFVNDDGTIAVLNSLRSENLLAWTLFETDGEVEDISVLDRDVYLVVKRGTKRNIEKLDPDSFFDNGITVTEASATDTWTGLSELEGEDVGVRVDNFSLEDNTVSSGSITTSQDGTTLNTGLKYFALVETVPLDNGGQLTGEFKSLVSANVRLHETRNMVLTKTNPDGTTSNFAPSFRSFGDDVLDQEITLFSGWKKVYIGGTGRDVTITVTQTQSSEFNVLAMAMEVA